MSVTHQSNSSGSLPIDIAHDHQLVDRISCLGSLASDLFTSRRSPYCLNASCSIAGTCLNMRRGGRSFGAGWNGRRLPFLLVYDLTD
jgi:hypothetical protein